MRPRKADACTCTFFASIVSVERGGGGGDAQGNPHHAFAFLIRSTDSAELLSMQQQREGRTRAHETWPGIYYRGTIREGLQLDVYRSLSVGYPPPIARTKKRVVI